MFIHYTKLIHSIIMKIVANWKQFLSPEKEIALARDLVEAMPLSVKHNLTILPSFLTVQAIVDLVRTAHAPITVGVQDSSASLDSAQTGNIRSDHVPVDTILIGHSERAQNNHETSTDNQHKLTVALSLHKKVILCFGEKAQVESDEELLVLLKSQLVEYRQNLTDEAIVDVTLAYEPQWSIGNTTTASSTIVKKVLALAQAFGFKKMLYGGSVDNTSLERIYFPELDGFLVGRASTTISSLKAIFTTLDKLA